MHEACDTSRWRTAMRGAFLALGLTLIMTTQHLELAHAAAPQVVTVDVTQGGDRLVRFRAAITKVSVGDTDAVDTEVVQSRALRLGGKKIGETDVLVWDARGTVTRLVVSVGVGTEGLVARLKAIFPDEQIRARAVGDTVVLSGTVSDPVISERVAKLAQGYVKGEKGRADVKILNFLTIKGRQQVQLRVKVAEVARTTLRQMGVNVWMRPEGHAAGIIGPSSSLAPGIAPDLGTAGAGMQPTTVEGGNQAVPLIAGPLDAGGGVFGIHFATKGTSSLPLSVAVNLMQQRGLAKVLSEPTLVAYSGQTADFLAGGEIPIPIPQGLAQTTIEFKKYGVQLSFTPTVLSHRTVHMKVSVSVSELDRSGASVQLQGVTVPALRTRHGQTTVRLRNGQSFAIAGLLQDRITSRSTKIPLLGDLPIIGALFRETSFDREELELVILVTAHLVRPLKPGEVPPLPGEDEVADPGPLAFFLLGSVDPELKGERRSVPAGPVGYSK